MLIARTLERPSAAEDGVFWWKEYRLVEDVRQEKFFLEMRYLCRIGEKVYARQGGRVALWTDPERTWETWTSGGSREEAIREALGDTDFLQAMSLEDIHQREVETIRREREAQERTRRTQETLARAWKELEDWKNEQEKLFHRRHGHKTGTDLQKALERTKKRLEPEHERLLGEVVRLRTLLENDTKGVCG